MPLWIEINQSNKIFKKIEFYQIIRYSSVGGVCALIEFISFSILVLKFNIYYLLANVLAFCIASFIGFWLQKYWTFKNFKKEYLAQSTKFYIIVFIGFLLNTFLVYLFIGVLGLHIFIGKPIQLFIVFFWNYSGQRFWTFRYKNEQTI